jgi:hypothetical protein
MRIELACRVDARCASEMLVIEVPQNSLATIGDAGSSWSGLRSAT